VYDEQGQLVASAFYSNHEYRAIDGVSLPKKIAVQMPQGLLRLQLDVDRWNINQPLNDPQATFELPRAQLGNYPFVDIADPNFVPPVGSAPPQPVQPRVSQQPEERRPKMRGFSWR
jgi:hypothetical protein